VPQVDHRVGQGLECVVHGADALEANQHAAELVLQGEHALDGAESFLEDRRIEQPLAPALGGLPAARVLIVVGHHAAIEDGLSVGVAVVDAIQADDGALQLDAPRASDARQFRQRLSQHG